MKERSVQAGIATFLLVVVFDQIIKEIARIRFAHGVRVASFFSLRTSTNTGAAFSIMDGSNSLLLWLTIIIFGVLVYFVSELPFKTSYYVPYAMILGGAFSNILDRAFFGGVTDFIAFSFWPSFNLADAAITVGAAWLGMNILLRDGIRKEATGARKNPK